MRETFQEVLEMTLKSFWFKQQKLLKYFPDGFWRWQAKTFPFGDSYKFCTVHRRIRDLFPSFAEVKVDP